MHVWMVCIVKHQVQIGLSCGRADTVVNVLVSELPPIPGLWHIDFCVMAMCFPICCCCGAFHLSSSYSMFTVTIDLYGNYFMACTQSTEHKHVT